MPKTKALEDIKNAFAVPVVMPKVRVPYEPKRVSFDCGTEGGADQSFKDEADINRIMKRYEVTGVMLDPTLRVQRVPRYEDISQMPEDFLEANVRVMKAKEAFDELPAAVRDRFANSPYELMMFLSNEANRDEAIKLGLVPPKEKPGAEKSGAPASDVKS